MAAAFCRVAVAHRGLGDGLISSLVFVEAGLRASLIPDPSARIKKTPRRRIGTRGAFYDSDQVVLCRNLMAFFSTGLARRAHGVAFSHFRKLIALFLAGLTNGGHGLRHRGRKARVD